MTITDRTAEPDDVFAARLAVIEAQPTLNIAADATEEAVVEAMKLWDGTTSSESADDWFRGLARAALAAMQPADETLRAAEPPCKVGDPDPTIHPGRYCSVEEWEDGFVCTRETGHPADWHIAGDSVQVCAVWPVAVLGGEL